MVKRKTDMYPKPAPPDPRVIGGALALSAVLAFAGWSMLQTPTRLTLDHAPAAPTAAYPTRAAPTAAPAVVATPLPRPTPVPPPTLAPVEVIDLVPPPPEFAPVVEEVQAAIEVIAPLPTEPPAAAPTEYTPLRIRAEDDCAAEHGRCTPPCTAEHGRCEVGKP